MLLKLLINPSDPPPEPLIVAGTMTSRKKDIIIEWCNTWTGNGNVRLCNGDDVVLTDNIYEISRYLGRVVDPALYGDGCMKSRTEVDHWLTFALGQLSVKYYTHVDYTEVLIYLDRTLLSRTWLCCKKFTLADIHVYCVLLKNKYLEKELTQNYPNITRWYKHVESLPIVKNAFIQIKKNTLPKEQIQFCVEKSTNETKTRKQEGKFVDLPGAEMGKVVVRFPPEASGYLHIGHAKAALLNQYYAESFQGQLIMRFDDTNPAKESTEFEDAILEDLRLLQIKPDRFTHTSDYFDIILDYCTKLIKEEKAFVDDTPADIMKEQREKKLKSDNRDNSVEKNLALWEEMQRGTEKGQECCVRAKIDYQSTNGCMRDPTIYRCKLELHPYTQDKYKVYPTYDFACPIVDSIENVTHTLRTTEYHDRDPQFYWILDTLQLRRPYIWEYSRLNMTHTVLSKRKLTWFVEEGLVDGWDDPRFPTVRGILRRGMTVEGLKQFIIAQGSSRSVVFMEWDKIWAFNKKIIDPVAFRYTALDYDQLVPVNVLDAKEDFLLAQNHPKDLSKGFRIVLKSSTIFIEKDDAKNLIEGKDATFINWGNLKIIELERDRNGAVVKVDARLNLENKDYKSTLKLTWVAQPMACINDDNAADKNSIPCYAVYFDHIMSTPVLGKNDDFKDFVSRNTRKEVKMIGEVALKNVKKGEIIQLQRKGFFICDVPYAPLNLYSSRERPLILFHIPDGHLPQSCKFAVSPTLQKEGQPKPGKQNASSPKDEKENIEEILFSCKLQKQHDKVQHLQNNLTRAQSILSNFHAGYKMLTKRDWIPKETPDTRNTDTRPKELHEVIQKLVDKIQKRLEKNQPIKDNNIRLLLNFKNEYTNITGQVWESGKPAAPAATRTQKDYISELMELSDEMQEQYDRIEHLKSSTDDKFTLNMENFILLELKIEYQNLSGGINWKPGQGRNVTVAPPRDVQEEYRMCAQVMDLHMRIKEQTDKVQTLKKCRDKSGISNETKHLLSLKTEYRQLTGQDWNSPANAGYAAIADSSPVPSDTSPLASISTSTLSPEFLRALTLVPAFARSAAPVPFPRTSLPLASCTCSTPANASIPAVPPDVNTEIKDDSKAAQILDEIRKQGDKVRSLQSSKADKSIIDQELKILSGLKNDYRNATDQNWKAGAVADAAATPAPVPKTEIKDISEGAQISDEIRKQGDKVRSLKSSKADKSIIDQEVKLLLGLKSDYKNATGQDWKPDEATAATVTVTPSSHTKAESEDILRIRQILDKVHKQTDKVWNMEKSNVSKRIVEQEIKVLESLRSDLLNANKERKDKIAGASATPVPDTRTELKDVSKAAQISDEIQKQGDKVRSLKSSKADKSIIDQEVKILLSLKNDYKNVTGQDWKPVAAAATPAPAPKPEIEDVSKVAQISDEIQKQGDKVRSLKSSKADKSIIDQEVKILLSLKSDYRNVTGQDWKPVAAAATPAPAPAPKTEIKDISEGAQISDEIQKQGDKVRSLKSSKADKSIIDQEVKILLSLKSDYKNVTGQDWKPIAAAATPAPAPKPEIEDVSKAAQISDEIQKQGDKVRSLKSSKADKSIIDQEVKILLSLKSDYKNVTSQDWKPVAAAATPAPAPKTEIKDISEGAQISDEIQKQGDKVRSLKSSKADKSIIDQEVKILLSLKSDYRNVTGEDWKPDAAAATPAPAAATPAPAPAPKTEIKDISEGAQISDEIQKQGDKVRSLKSSKADKSIIDQEVAVLLKLKDDYKKATGQDWKPMKAEAEPKKKKQESPKSEKPVEKAVGKDADTSKTGTRLGLEAKKNENFFDWYSQIITKSGMIEYYDVSGCYILRPWSYAIWKMIKEYIDRVITSLGVHECYFPIFVTRSVLEKEKSHIADFAPEVAWVTKCGDSDLAEPIAIRPTSETVMYPAYAKWLKSDTELPLRLNQWNNVVRWEFKDPKPFLRTREFLWQEGHTAFATKAEADEEVLIILDMYARVYEDLLAVPVIKGRKTEKEKFAGGDYTTTVEAFISTNGRAIQGATSHHLGQNFSKMFNIQVEGVAEGDEKTFVYQNSWGLTTRTIGVMIMVHGDDKGLVLPPKVASVQAVVVPCGITASTTATQREILKSECKKLVDNLMDSGLFKVYGDFRNNRTPGWKFNHWELKGVPVRIELGPKDLEKNQVTFVRRDTSERSTAKNDEVIAALASLLEDIQTNLLERARKNLNEHIKQVEDWNDFGPELNKKNLLLSPFCGEMSCEERIKVDSAREDSDEPGASMGAKSLCIPFEQPELPKPLNEMKCIHYCCTSKPKFYTLFGRSY